MLEYLRDDDGDGWAQRDDERNKGASRTTLLVRLSLTADRWVLAKDALGQMSEEGPWPEDLHELVEEGLVVSTTPLNEFGMNSLVRLAA